MSYKKLVGLEVSDPQGYSEYRKAMMPILQAYGGRFTYDFQIAQVLKSEASEPINRVFIIEFPNQDQHDKFFSDAEYLKVKEKWFNASVRSVGLIEAIQGL